MKIVLDFETYYDSKDFSLFKETTEAYINHEKFEAICCAVVVENLPPKVFVGDEMGHFFKAVDWNKVTMYAHQCAFDAAILGWRFGCYPRNYVCTKRLAVAHGLHHYAGSSSLRDLLKWLGGTQKGELKTDGKRLVDLSAEELAALRTYAAGDAVGCKELAQYMGAW